MSGNRSTASFNTKYLERYIMDDGNSMASSLIASASSLADKFSCSCNGSYAREQVASEGRRREATYDLDRLTSDFYANEGIHRQGSFVEHDDDTVSSISASFMTPPRNRSRREIIPPVRKVNSRELLGDGSNTDFVSYDGRPDKTAEDDELTTSTTTTVQMSCRSKHHEGDSSIGTSASNSASSWAKTCEKVIERKEKQKVVFHMEGPLFERLKQRASSSTTPRGERIMTMSKVTPQSSPTASRKRTPTPEPEVVVAVPNWQKRRSGHEAKTGAQSGRTVATANESTSTGPRPRRMFLV